jgi:hypothetical protein
MQRSRGTAMEVVVIGMGRYTILKDVVEKLRHRVKVILVPGDELVVYINSPRSGFKELYGKDAEHYLKSLTR